MWRGKNLCNLWFRLTENNDEMHKENEGNKLLHDKDKFMRGKKLQSVLLAAYDKDRHKKSPPKRA